MPQLERLLIALLAAALLAAPALAQDAAAPADDPATRQFDFANGLYVRGEAYYAQAAEQYSIFLRDHPNDARCDEALFRLGECYRKSGKLQEALTTFAEHARRFPTGESADRTALRTGQVLDALGRHDEAIAAFKKIAEGTAAPEFRQAARYSLATALLAAAQADEALKIFVQIADTEGDRFRPFALYQLGLAYAGKGTDDEAVKRFRQLAALDAELAPEALFRVGEIEFKREHYADAAAAYRAVAEQHADSPYAGTSAYGLVQSLMRAKAYEDAIKAYGTLKDLVPKPVRPQSDYLVGNAHYELGRYDAALALYEAAAKAAAGTELALKAAVKMAWCRYFLKDFETLATSGTKLLDEQPKLPDADMVHYLVAEALLQLKRPQDALLHYETIVKDFPASAVLVEAEYKIGWCLFDKGDYESARQHFLVFADKHRDDARAADAVARAAECSIKLVKMADAAADYQRLLADYPQSPLAEGALFQLGLAYVSLDDQDKAVATFLDFVKRYPKSTHASDAYYWIGAQKEKAGSPDEAIAYLTKSLETATEARFVERARYKLATLHHAKGEFEQAATLLLAMLKANADADVPVKTYLWLAGYLVEQKRFDEAQPLYEAFPKKFPEASTPKEASAEAHFGLGQCLQQQGKWEPALGQYKQAIALGGSFSLAAELHAGECLHELGKDDEAVAQFTELLKAEEPAIEATALDRLGTIYFAQAKNEKDPARAVELYMKAREHFLRVVILYGNAPERPECMLRVGQCNEAAGQGDEARKQYRELVEAYPDSPFAAEARTRLGASEEGAATEH